MTYTVAAALGVVAALALDLAVLRTRLVHAPVEDLAFGFALVLASLSIWVRLGPSDASDGD